MPDRELMRLLWCPSCQAGAFGDSEPGHETESESSLTCEACGESFPIHFGFPTLIPQDALTGSEWDLWRRHLAKFQARRMARLDNPSSPVNRLATRSKPHPAFAEFTGIDQGVVLDLGCGPGNFRHTLGSSGGTYVGLDPLALPEVADFHFVQGVAEYLPFRPGVFTDIVILSALDHFRDVGRFASEARRVLAPGGRLHVLQSVHQVRGPISAVRAVAHLVKDSWDERFTKNYGRDVPKHITEFTEASLISGLGGAFEPVATESYSATWYSPIKLFMTFARSEDLARELQPTG